MSKTWFITGASSGFGKALAELVLARGDNAVLTARRLESLQAIAAPYGERALAVQLDVTDAASRAAALKAAQEKFGRIDVLANIAGAGAYGALEEFTSAQIRSNMELNFFAAAELSRDVLPQMRAQKSGHILSLTSMPAWWRSPATACTARPSSRWRASPRRCTTRSSPSASA